MDEEKLLAYLSLKRQQPINKASLIVNLLLDIVITTGTLFYGLLCEVFAVSVRDIIYLSFLVITCLAFCLWYRKAVNPVIQFVFPVVVFTASSLKLFYLYILFADAEFIWIHLITLIEIVIAAACVWIRAYRILHFLNDHTLEQTRYAFKAKAYVLWTPLAVTVTIILYTAISKLIKKPNHLDGAGIVLWILVCLFLWMALIALPKYIVTRKYKVAEFFEEDNPPAQDG